MITRSRLNLLVAIFMIICHMLTGSAYGQQTLGGLTGVVTDSQGRLSYVSPAFARILGISSGQFGNRQADELLQSRTEAGLSSTHGAGGLLDYPHYTRPAEFRGLTVPEVLSSGNHEQIRRWRREQALRKTLRNRPDLLRDAELSAEDRSFLRGLEVPAGGAQNKDSV